MKGPGRDALIVEFMPFALRLARSAGPQVEPDDARSEAFVGLTEAADSYDPAKGSFAAFARTYIAGRLKRAAEKAPMVRKSCRLEQRARRARAARAALVAAGDHSPPMAEIASRAGLDEATCREALSGRQIPIDPDRIGVIS